MITFVIFLVLVLSRFLGCVTGVAIIGLVGYVKPRGDTNSLAYELGQ